jgi:hypothetical protein
LITVLTHTSSQIKWLLNRDDSVNVVAESLSAVGLVASNARAHFRIQALRSGHKNNPLRGRASQPVLRKPFSLRRFTAFLTAS